MQEVKSTHLVNTKKGINMYQLLFVLNIIHRISLIILLATFALVPVLSKANIVGNYVLLPILFILLSMTTIYIENKLNKYQKQLTVTEKDEKAKKCFIRYGICCLHH